LLSALALNRSTWISLDPSVWIDLPEGKDRRHWHGALDSALESMSRVCSGTANLFAAAKHTGSPGIRLREQRGFVEAQWQPPPNISLETGTIPQGAGALT
jgi:hypothetical protein